MPTIDYAGLFRVTARDDAPGVGPFVDALTDAWLDSYRRETAGQRDIVQIAFEELTYLYDATTSPGIDEPDNRVLAVWGRSRAPSGPRDSSRLRGHPSPQRDNAEAVDRGHLAAHAIGGGYDLNLIPQLASLNRGRSAEGHVWRELERYCATHPGTFFFVRAIYSDITDHPSGLDYGVLLSDGELRVETFDNR